MAKKSLEQQAKEALPSATQRQYPLARFSEGLPDGVHTCTLPSVTAEDLVRINMVIEGCTQRLWDMREQCIEVRDFIVYDSWEELPDTGEIVQVKRLVLISPNGDSWQTPSRPARQSFARQIARLAVYPANLLPPYDPPLLVQVKGEKSADRTKGDWLHLVVIGGSNGQGLSQEGSVP
jgi:hypothetical protein